VQFCCLQNPSSAAILSLKSSQIIAFTSVRQDPLAFRAGDTRVALKVIPGWSPRFCALCLDDTRTLVTELRDPQSAGALDRYPPYVLKACPFCASTVVEGLIRGSPDCCLRDST
jgi:hypothetical protein